MPLYGTVWLVEYGTMRRHGSSPIKYSCGKVAGTRYLVSPLWRPVHAFMKLVYWGFASRPFGRQAPVRGQFKKHGFSVTGTNGPCEIHSFFCSGNKGSFWRQLQNHGFFLLREQMGVSRPTNAISGKIVAGCCVFFCCCGS